MFKCYPYKSLFVLFLLVFLIIASVVYVAYGAGSSTYLVEQMLHREQVIVRSGSSAIRSLLTSSANSLSILSKNESIVSPNAHTESLLKEVVSNWHGTSLNLISLVNLNGNIVAAASNQDTIQNYSASAVGRDYFEEGKKLVEGQYFIGQPIIPLLPGLKSKFLIPVSVPVYKEGKLTGILVCTYYVSDLIQDYLDPLKISNQTDLLIVDTSGNLLVSNQPEIIGQNLYTYVREHPFIGHEIILRRVQAALEENIEHKFDIAIPRSSDGKLTRTIIATAPINFPGTSWVLVITTPAEDALVFATPFIMRHLTGLIVIIFVNVIGVIAYYRRFIKK